MRERFVRLYCGRSGKTAALGEWVVREGVAVRVDVGRGRDTMRRGYAGTHEGDLYCRRCGLNPRLSGADLAQLIVGLLAAEPDTEQVTFDVAALGHYS